MRNKVFLKVVLITLSILLSNGIFAQKLITGRVISASNGQPLGGVNVVAKGTTIGVMTDGDGSYKINVPSEVAYLDFSFIGYLPKSIPINDRTSIDVILEENVQMLSEVVVVGYGEQSRSIMTTSVSKLDTKVLEHAPRTNVGTALQGTIAGLRVTTTSGQPGQTPQILLRGGTDWSGGSAPLVIVDGVVSSLYGLNSEDIESIDVLKDAAATAIYGARSANGVILISTKKGKVQKSEINYSYKYGRNYMRETYEYLNARDYIYYNRLGLMNYKATTGKTNFDGFATSPSIGWGTGGNMINSVFTTQRVTSENRQYLNDPEWQWMIDPINPNDTILFQDRDLSKLIYQDSYLSDHHISFSGGNDKGLYSLGLGYIYDQGIVLGSELKRFTANLNSSYKLSNKLSVNSIFNFTHSSPKYPYLTDDEGSYNQIFERAAGFAPTARIYNSDGSLNPWVNTSIGNPLYYKDKFLRKSLEQRITGGVNLDYEILPGFNLTLKGNLFAVHLNRESFNKSYYSGGSLNTARIASASYSRSLTQQYNVLLNYKNTFGANHHLNLLLGGEYYDYYSFYMYAATKNSPTDLIYTMNAGSEASGVPTSSTTATRILSILGRITYDFNTRYLVNINFRYDGSSKLPENKWGFFPGISLGWNLHNESFFKNSLLSRYVNNFKPRVSYGVNGNVDNLSDFGAFGGYALTGIYNNEKGYYNNALPLLNLKWESSVTFDVGVDLGLFENRINLIADYFIRDIKDKLASYNLPFETGFSSITTNNGVLRNKGFELEMKANVINKGVRWDIGATFYTVKNYVVKLPDNGLERNRQGGTQIFDPKSGKVVWVGGLQEGKRVGLDEVYAHKMEYVYPDDAAVAEHATRVDMYYPSNARTVRFPGDAAWLDIDKNDTIDYRDRIFVGRTTPSAMGGFTSSLSWKNVSLFIRTDYAIGHLIHSYIRVRGITQVQGSQNSTTEVLKSWTPENRYTDVPRFDLTDPRYNHGAIHQPRQNSRYWEKGDYLCLREVTLSYNLPSTILKEYIKNLKIYVTGSNLKYFTKYSGPAPEQGGIDIGRYPVPRVYTFGLDVTF